MMVRRAGWFLLLSAACSPAVPASSAGPASATPASAAAPSASSTPASAAPSPSLAELPAVDGAAALAHIRTLASDEFEGRGPATPGEEHTVKYLVEQLGAAGLSPGNPDGTWVQNVPLLGISPSGYTPLVLSTGSKKASLAPATEVVAFSQRGTESIALAGSEVVFVGHGVQAPEFEWDDFKGIDVKGKTLVMLVNDPPVRDAAGDLDAKVFGGKAMTLYGRWTYKYDKAAELGAAAVFIVHETEAAGYPYSVVQGFAGERFDLITPDKNMGRAAIQGWLSREAAIRLFQLAGQDYEKQAAAAASRSFQPVPLGMKSAMSFRQTLRRVDSKNVIGKLAGSDPTLARESVIYTAHWDHLGIGKPKDGDTIYNGASDNASGTAALIEIARALAKAEPHPKRSVLFLATTAEEQGLLGSRYYTEFPLYPLEQTLANINIDNNLPMWGRTRDVIVVGLGASDLDDYLRTAAAEQGQVLTPDAEPEKGFYYRSDHFNFAKAGVPALAVGDGSDYIGKPASFGREKQAEYLASDYHSPSDQVKPGWEMSGFVEQAKLLLAVGYRVAQAPSYPEWKPGNEFRKVREDSLKEQAK